MNTQMKRYCCSATLLILLANSGCQLGPEALKVSHLQYNRAIQQTVSEQMLLNLVRLRYHEAPVFLEVGGVSAQFVFDQSGDISATLTENVGPNRLNPLTLGLGAGASYTERPTITYSQLSGDEFVGRLLAPISIEKIVLMAHSGWRIDRVMSLLIQEMNGLDNARMASGPTPAAAPKYEAFARATKLLLTLQQEQNLYFEYEKRIEDVSDPIPANLITADSLIEASKSGTRFRRAEDAADYVLTRKASKLILRLADAKRQDERSEDLRDLLHLERDRTTYDLVVARTNRGGHLDDSGLSQEIALDTRSLLGVMFLLSQNITVPESHEEAGLTTTTLNKDGERFDWSILLGDYFRVTHQRTKPRDACVSVQHRGYWFYIADCDLTSKSTFALVSQLFSLQAGGGEKLTPVLTLPVGG